MLMLTGRVYDNVKRFVQIWIPAISTLYFTLGNIWGFPKVEEVMGTLAAIAVFLGAILQLSSKSYYGKNDPYAGDVVITTDEEGSTYTLAMNEGPEEMIGKDTVTFKVVKRPLEATDAG